MFRRPHVLLPFLLLGLGACLSEDESSLTSTETELAKTVSLSGTVARSVWAHNGPYSAVAGTFRVAMTGSGDADLYVRKGSRPTASAYDCRPYKSGSSETCVLELTGPTQVYVSAYGYATTSTYQLAISYEAPTAPACGNGIVETGETCDGGAQACTALPGGYTGGQAICRADCGGWDVSACTTSSEPPTVVTDRQTGTIAKNVWKHYGPYPALSGEFRAVMTGTGDVDLYVRKNGQPTATAYDCRPYKSGSSESCLLALTATTPVYVSVRGYAATSTYQLDATYNAPSTSTPREWPNSLSKANSDPWIAQHHSEITVMKPRILALNFVNAKSMDQMRTQFNAVIAATKESSRYRGYANARAPAFLDYQIGYAIDLRDTTPPLNWPYRNSTRYPRENPADGYWTLDYEQLFTQQFADYYRIPDPQNPSRNLTLTELVDRGLVHEVWIFGDGDVPDANAAEVLEIKPYYDAQRVMRTDIPMNRCAGNGCFDEEDTIPLKRSLRIAWFNQGRGPGCFMESMAHGLEQMGGRGNNIIPYLTTYFSEFAGMQLDQRYGLPFQNWYGCAYGQPCLSYPSDTSVTYQVGTANGTINNYDPVCGSAHFTPNSRQQYDLQSPITVSTSCLHFRDGTGQKSPFTRSAYTAYEALAQDCMGPFLVWWRQNIPGQGNTARDNSGAPMLNWWPFLFY